MKSICFPPSAYCRLPLRGVRVGGALGPYRSIRQDVSLAGKEETLVTLKLKEPRGNVYENKGPVLSDPG
jgi:hypothetical protein